MTIALLTTYLALHVAFTWARIVVFRIDGPTPRGVRLIELCATCSILAGGLVLGQQESPPSLGALGACTAAASAGLFFWGLKSIRPGQLSAAFSDDVPTFLVTQGPYRYIRNPFYLAYLLAHAVPWVATGATAALPGLAIMTAIYARAALLEERKFRASACAPDWEAYRQRTGRFLPRLTAEGRR